MKALSSFRSREIAPFLLIVSEPAECGAAASAGWRMRRRGGRRQPALVAGCCEAGGDELTVGGSWLLALAAGRRPPAASGCSLSVSVRSASVSIRGPSRWLQRCAG